MPPHSSLIMCKLRPRACAQLIHTACPARPSRWVIGFITFFSLLQEKATTHTESSLTEFQCCRYHVLFAAYRSCIRQVTPPNECKAILILHKSIRQNILFLCKYHCFLFLSCPLPKQRGTFPGCRLEQAQRNVAYGMNLCFLPIFFV